MKYRNKYEEETAKKLTEAGVRFAYESERIPYTVQGEYIPDFVIRTMDNHKVYIETKGNGRSFDPMARRKLIAVKRDNPELDIRIVFYSNGKIGPRRKDGSFMRQSDWAEKYGFEYAIREIPEDWLGGQ